MERLRLRRRSRAGVHSHAQEIEVELEALSPADRRLAEDRVEEGLDLGVDEGFVRGLESDEWGEVAESHDDLLLEAGVLRRPKLEDVRPELRSEFAHGFLIVEVEFGEGADKGGEGREMGRGLRLELAEESKELAEDDGRILEEGGRLAAKSRLDAGHELDILLRRRLARDWLAVVLVRQAQGAFEYAVLSNVHRRIFDILLADPDFVAQHAREA